MSKKKDTKVFILILILLILVMAGIGGAYIVLTKQTDNLDKELRDLNTKKDLLLNDVEVLKAEIEEKKVKRDSISSEPQEPEQIESEETVSKIKGLVAIDPGHQGSWVDMSALEPNAPGSSEMKAKATTGTTGRYTNTPEYELNLDISLMLAEELRSRGYDVLLSREDNDTAISNAQRAVKANDAGADIAVRIHANGSEDPETNGALTLVGSPSNPYIGHLYEKSSELAEDVLTSYCAVTGIANIGMQQVDNMTGLNWSTIPTMILEMGFMTNESDDRKMADSEFRKLMVKGIADGIDNYYSKNPSSYAWAETGQESGNSPKLQKTIDSIYSGMISDAENVGEMWAVAAKDLLGGGKAGYHAEVKMKSASLMKLFIMAVVYDRVCYPASDDRYISFPEAYDGELKELITKMITVSDNSAANEIVQRLGNGDYSAGMRVVNDYCNENGYINTHMGRLFLDNSSSDDNYTSANDCMNLISSIYEGTCVNQEASGKMLEYLKNQTVKNKICAGVNGVQTASKTGELSGGGLGYAENDIAIIWGHNSTYVLCVLSGNLQLGNQAAIDRIVKISSEIYMAMEE